jgi:D-arabinose 1-dehydrogenase-like Zn-dependent alcohol dehydrogenase
VRIPEGVPDGVASAASCALRTVIHAMDRVGRIERISASSSRAPARSASSRPRWRTTPVVSEVIVVGAPERRLALAKRWGASAVVSIDEFPTAEARWNACASSPTGAAPTWSSSCPALPMRSRGPRLSPGGGRYAVVGQLGGPLTPVQAALFVRKGATILGVQSADIGQFWKALEFVRRTSARYDFEAMLTTRYPLDRINDASRACGHSARSSRSSCALGGDLRRRVRAVPPDAHHR